MITLRDIIGLALFGVRIPKTHKFFKSGDRVRNGRRTGTAITTQAGGVWVQFDDAKEPEHTYEGELRDA